MKIEGFKRSLALAIIYFFFSAIITGWFIARKFRLYESVDLMTLSGGIAGAKWLIQIIAALIFLREKRWMFIKEIGFVALIGSAALLIYYFLPTGWELSSLIVSVGVSVAIMIVLYFRAVKKLDLSLNWFWSWIICLIAAILLQLTVVFGIL